MLTQISIYTVNELGDYRLVAPASRVYTALQVAASFALAYQALYVVLVETETKTGRIYFGSDGKEKGIVGAFDAESVADYLRLKEFQRQVKARETKTRTMRRAA